MNVNRRVWIREYIYIYIYIYFSFPLGGGFMESRTQPTRPNFPCLLRILYEASTVGTECAPSIWPPGNSSGLGVTIVLLTPWFWSCPESNSPSGLGVTPSVTPRCGSYTQTPGVTTQTRGVVRATLLCVLRVFVFGT